MNITTNGMTISKALLDHNGNVTLFDGNDMQAAVDAAVDGDIIYLSLGTFKPFTINKMISIRGIGENSVIDGDVEIAIPGSPSLKNPLFETLSISNSISIKNEIHDVVIRKCKIEKFVFYADIVGAIIDRCYIRDFILSSHMKDITINNTQFRIIRSQSVPNNVTFINCDLIHFYPSGFSGTIINSILYTAEQNQDTNISSSVLINTLLYRGFYLDSSCAIKDCYYDTNISTIDFLSSGYLGNDGTVVGIYGGKTPYTLEPSVPHVTNSSISLDEDKKRLNVKLTMSPQ